MSRQLGFIEPPPWDAPEEGLSSAPTPELGFIDPLEHPKWIVQSLPIPGLPDARAILSAVDHVGLGLEP